MIGDADLAFLDETWRAPARKSERSGGRAPLILLAALAARGGQRGGGARAGGGGGSPRRDRLERLTRKTPEVMVKVTGSQRGASHTLAHLDYIARHGKLEVETEDGEIVRGKEHLRAKALQWEEDERQFSYRQTMRAEPVTSTSMVLSMPPGSDPKLVYQAARAFAHVELEGFPHMMALHTDTGHPHVHITVASRDGEGRRFHPEKADLARYREVFARELRARGVEAEATPRRARGVVQKHERVAVHKKRERWERDEGSQPDTLASSDRKAARLARQGRDPRPEPWETAIFNRQRHIRDHYERAAQALGESGDPSDRRLADDVRRFVREMPSPATRDREKARGILRDTTPPPRQGPQPRLIPLPREPERER